MYSLFKLWLCFFIGHKNTELFEKGDYRFFIEENQEIEKTKHIHFCQRCGLCYWV